MVDVQYPSLIVVYTKTSSVVVVDEVDDETTVVDGIEVVVASGW